MAQAAFRAERLPTGATVAVIGGGPAGSFFAVHLLRLARHTNKRIRVVVFERLRPPPRNQPESISGTYRGCPRCAGGVSPRLSDALANLGVEIPDDTIQARIQSIGVLGRWKPVLLQVPEDRKMMSVFRGTLPSSRDRALGSLDSLLIDVAVREGAELVGSTVTRVYYDDQRRPVLRYRSAGADRSLTADFVAFAGGVNEMVHSPSGRQKSADLFRTLQPRYTPPAMRKALIVELEAPADSPELTSGRLHYLEGSYDRLDLDMCSIMPKQGHFTITLIGRSVDRANSHRDNQEVIQQFLNLPRVRRLLPGDAELAVRCLCNPFIVVGTAKRPFAHRAAALGDLAAARLYKDGMLAAHDMSHDLAEAVVEFGTDIHSLAAAYGPTIRRFRRENRYASLIFFLYRWFFTSGVWSRIIYQTYGSEKKSSHASRRNFEKIFWAVSSGDENYEQIAWKMLRPSTAWRILTSGILVTLRNWLTEHAFGLTWAQLGRSPVAVPVETLKSRREQLLDGQRHEFECIYSIELRASADIARNFVGKLGETNRPYLHPRGIRIQRVCGQPLTAGCKIHYHVFGGLLTFDIVQEESGNENLIRYRVAGGFANDGLFTFLIEPESINKCKLTVYLAFDYARGARRADKLFWWTFRLLFPEYVHDVLWNHALCQFKQAVESSLTNTNRIAGLCNRKNTDAVTANVEVR
jgi:flavin-dependent dehydrogenase